MQRDKITDKEIQKAYDDGLYKLKAVINSAFSLYSTDGVLVPTNLNRKVTKKDMLLLKEQFDKLPSDLELPEQSRVDYYLAMSQTSVSKLISATLGIALIGITMKLGKILRKNNKTAVLEEYRYQTERLDLTPKQAKKVRDKKKEITKDDYVFSDEKAKEYVPWLDRLWLNHDQTLNRIDNSINEMLKQGMRSQDIAEKMFPENAESMRKDNIPKAIREASNNVKRLARTEAARREDEMAEATFQATGVKQIKFVNEPGACKKCIPLQGGYPLDESPRIPKDTHPNCRCRRVPLKLEDETKPKINMDSATKDVTLIKQRLDWYLEDFKKETDIDVMETIKNGKFGDESNPYDDIKAKFIKYLLEQKGYTQLPKQVKEYSGTTVYRGIRPSSDGKVRPEDIDRHLKKGDMHISGALTSANGRGIYVTEFKLQADFYSTKGKVKDGKVFEYGISENANAIDINEANMILYKTNLTQYGTKYDINVDIIAIVSGNDIIKNGATLNILNRGAIEWKKETKTKSTE
ncbi:hypothetical protein FC40_GL000684 [Ligilactobacillus hayakitensis DSM 18933 = JCM 14209]|uniref:Phage Mu protein F like protein n=1 Tax=Ligilactobacillus hayakitensis DSM 18933 = JCM 14209 TaxID=1423755 RepID=A0A0R1WM46_9LACO|nr:hypothetical protein FC40_GL000684 [Ligilactobacillus hayakitensis DSM 18933 = JCM 14209]